MDFNASLRQRILVAIGAGGLSLAGLTDCGGSDSGDQPATSGGAAGAAGSTQSTGGNKGGTGGNIATGGNNSLGTSGGMAPTGGAGMGLGIGGLITVRRPFLVGSEIRTATAISRGDWLDDNPPPSNDSQLDPGTREMLARVWLKDALEEHASIAAFARFSLMMLAHGAPSDLVAAAQRASLDEVRHARACFTLAHRYSGLAQGPSELSLQDAIGMMSLPELAALTVREGCVGETLGALLAQHQLTLAVDPWVRALLQQLVKDETRHSELAWRFVRWALKIGRKDVQRAVVASFDELSDAERFVEIRNYDVDHAAWHAHGRVTCMEARNVTAAALKQVIGPCVEAMLALSDAPFATSHNVEPAAMVLPINMPPAK